MATIPGQGINFTDTLFPYTNPLSTSVYFYSWLIREDSPTGTGMAESDRVARSSALLSPSFSVSHSAPSVEDFPNVLSSPFVAGSSKALECCAPLRSPRKNPLNPRLSSFFTVTIISMPEYRLGRGRCKDEQTRIFRGAIFFRVFIAAPPPPFLPVRLGTRRASGEVVQSRIPVRLSS